MNKKTLLCVVALLVGATSLWAQTAKRAVDYVNPMIGTDGMGHTFPGACAPFGIVQLSPDTDTIPHNINGTYQKKVYEYCAGYQYHDTTIVGFSHTHFSGTGPFLFPVLEQVQSFVRRAILVAENEYRGRLGIIHVHR